MTKLVAWVVTIDTCWFFLCFFLIQDLTSECDWKGFQDDGGLVFDEASIFFQKWRITLVEISYGKKREVIWNVSSESGGLKDFV